MTDKHLKMFHTINVNKNAFQSDAYRPLADRMPESASRGRCLLLGGVSGPAGSALGGWVSAPGGRGVSGLGGWASQHALRQTPLPPCEQNDRQV